MKYADLVERVREIGGKLSDEQASSIILEIIRQTTKDVEYASCDHDSNDMVRYYGKTGTCGICADKKNRQLVQMVKTGPASASFMIGALSSLAISNRFLEILRKHAVCSKCHTPIIKVRRHGCSECRADRSWLSKITRRSKSS